jgi:hypothetical protein
MIKLIINGSMSQQIKDKIDTHSIPERQIRRPSQAVHLNHTAVGANISYAYKSDSIG